MIIMPNIPAVVETDKVRRITKHIVSTVDNSMELTEAREWSNDIAVSPDFVMLDPDGDTHLFYVIVTFIDPEDAIAEISDGLLGKKDCKKLTKKFIEDFEDELCEGSRVSIEIMYLIVNDDTVDKGTCRVLTLYSRKVKPKE